MAANKEGMEAARRVFAEKLRQERKDFAEAGLPDPGGWEARQLAFRSAGRDARRAEYSEAAERRILRKASGVVRSIRKEIDRKVFRDLGKRPKGPEGQIWDANAQMIRKNYWKKLIKDRRIQGRDNQRVRDFAIYMKRAMQDPRNKRDLVKAAEIATSTLAAEAADVPLRVRIELKALTTREFVPPDRLPDESPTAYDARVAMAKVRHYVGGSAISPDLPPLEFNDLYMKRPPQRRSFQPTFQDSRVKAMIAAGVEPREAVEAVGDAMFKISREQWETVRKLNRMEPVYVAVDDPNALPMPNRAEFGYGPGDRDRYEAALGNWLKAIRKDSKATAFYHCKACTGIVRTGHKCRCAIDKRSLREQQLVRYPYAFKPPKRPVFEPTPRLIGESPEAYEAKIRRIRENADAAYEENYQKALNEWNRKRTEWMVPFENMNRLRNIPGARRLLVEIDKKVRASMGPIPHDPVQRAEYQLERARRAAEEYQREVQDRVESTLGDETRIPSPEAWRAARRKGGAIDSKRLIRAMEREKTASLPEKLSVPGTVMVSATSKAEAERKATGIAISSNQRRIDQLRRKMARGEKLSVAERMAFDRLIKMESIAVEETILPTKLKGVAGIMDDLGGNIAGLAVAGLAVFAILKAFKARSA